jgi:NADH:ubiquinone oxidoreductase subunit 5 (subunit L)/multisubunit Na+/H+ antiporter MnhA subunit
MNHETQKPTTNPWFVLFEVIAIAIGLLLFGNFIKGQFSEPITTGIGNYMMSLGAMILLALGIAAAIVIGVFYLIYWLFYKPRYKDPYDY